LIHENYVAGWDDPRILTLNGLRRRGFTGDSLNSFCDYVGITRRGNEMHVSYKLLEHCLKEDLEDKAPRSMCILDPATLIIDNVEEDFSEKVDAPLFPRD